MSEKNEQLKAPLSILLVFIFAIIFSAIFSAGVTADEIVHDFKNPSFSGVGTSAHYLTVENQEKSRRDEIRDDI